jgi:aldehyde:ferredoxin oxidoreductase
MLRRIAFRIGIGDWLANGVEFCAKQLGQDAENVLMALKGSPILSSDPRSGSLSEALGILVNPRGGDDLNTTHTLVDSFPEWARLRGWSPDEFLRWWRDWLDMPLKLKRTLFGDPLRSTALDNRDPEGKPDLVCWYSKLVALYDSLGLCMFPVNLLGAWGPTHMANLCSSYLGIDYSPEDVMHIGERVATLMKSFSVKHSCRDGREAWPDRFYNEPLPEGPMKGQRLSRIVMEDLTKTYYALMGWDYQTGKPHLETLVRLGLQDIADDIW